MASLRVVRPGMLTTIQDLGRWGHQALGVPVAGPMDVYSHRLANRLVANPDEAAALEISLVGPELEAAGDVICAVAGAEFDMVAGGYPVPVGRAFRVPSGSRLRFGRRVSGARACLAVRGGIAVPSSLGSRATSLVSRMGPLGGRALVTGDILPIGRAERRDRGDGGVYSLPLPDGGARLRAICRRDDRLFPAAALEQFLATRYRVTAAANRMGYRLEGPPLEPAAGGDILSEATPMGSVQVPRSGQPILLMADRQTTGGYARIATVISADLPLAAQLMPGDWIEFAACTRADALEALHRQEGRLGGRLDMPAPRFRP